MTTKPPVVDRIIDALDRLNTDDLRKLNHVVVFKLKQAQQLKKFEFRVGDKVFFYANKLHCNVEGMVTKINRSTIEVRATTGEGWRVSPSMLVHTKELDNIKKSVK